MNFLIKQKDKKEILIKMGEKTVKILTYFCLFMVF